MAHFGKLEYWEARYTKDCDSFEWYQDYFGVKDNITQHIAPDSDILILGCGNSKLGAEMYEDGFTRIKNVDWSPTVIN